MWVCTSIRIWNRCYAFHDSWSIVKNKLKRKINRIGNAYIVIVILCRIFEIPETHWFSITIHKVLKVQRKYEIETNKYPDDRRQKVMEKYHTVAFNLKNKYCNRIKMSKFEWKKRPLMSNAFTFYPLGVVSDNRRNMKFSMYWRAIQIIRYSNRL